MFSDTFLVLVGKRAAKFISGFAMLSALATGTVGCKAEDAALIGGTIAIVAGAIAIEDALDHSSNPGSARCHGGYREQCISVRDRWGRLHTDCGHRVWDSCASYYSSTNLKLSSTSALAMSIPSDTVSQMALKYGLPLESAEKLTTILQSAAAGNSDSLTTMGLSGDEMKRLAAYQMPSQAALDKIASSLAVSSAMARGLVEALMGEMRSQMADVSSPVWTACQKTGKWKTNANGGTCKSTSWTGCSPETGASICVAVK